MLSPANSTKAAISPAKLTQQKLPAKPLLVAAAVPTMASIQAIGTGRNFLGKRLILGEYRPQAIRN